MCDYAYRATLWVIGARGERDGVDLKPKTIPSLSLTLSRAIFLGQRCWAKTTLSMLWLKESPNIMLCKALGKVTLSMLWSKELPNVKFSRVLGKVTSSMLWLKHKPNVKFCTVLGKATLSMLWSKELPYVKFCKVLGKVTLSKHCWK